MGLRYHDRKEAPKRGKKTNTNDSSVRMSFTKLARSGGAQHTAPIRSSLWVRHRNTDWLETQWEEHNMTIVGGILCFFFRVLASPRRLFPRLFIVLGKPVSFFFAFFPQSPVSNKSQNGRSLFRFNYNAVLTEKVQDYRCGWILFAVTIKLC